MSRRPTSSPRLRCAPLEDRVVPAVVFVDDSLVAGASLASLGGRVTIDRDNSGTLTAGDQVTFALGEPGETTGLTFGQAAVGGDAGTAFGTGSSPGAIQAAVAFASAGDTIQVARGVYTLSTGVTVNKSLTILGPQAGVDARPSANTTRVIGSSGEAVVDANGLSQGFVIAASDVTIDGFDVRNATTALIDSLGSTAYSGAAIRNNIVHNASTAGGSKGIRLTAVSDSTVEGNNVFTVADSGIEAGASVAGASVNAVVRFNEVHDLGSGGTTNSAIYAFAVGSTATALNVTIQGNLVYNHFGNDAIKVGAKNGQDRLVDGGSVVGNVVHDTAQDGITIDARNTLVQGNEVYHSFSTNGAVYVEHGDSGVSVLNNSVHDNSPGQAAVLIGFSGRPASPTGMVVSGNSIVGNSNNFVFFRDNTGGTATLDASGNWYGSAAQATVVASAKSTAGSTATTNRIDFTPWLNNGIDADLVAPGFQPDYLGLTVAPSTVSLQTGGAGRIQEAIDLAAVGATIDVVTGTYVEDVNLNKAIAVNLAGTVTGKVSGTTGVYTATGALALGDGSTTGVGFASALNVGGQAVTLLDSDAAALNGLTTLAGGSLTATNGVLLGGTLAGSGTVAGAVAVAAGGTVSPGVAGTGTLATGSLAFQAPAAALAADLNGTAAGTGYDQVSVTGGVSLGGAMLNLTLGYTPAVGDSFVLVDNDGVDPVSGELGGLNGAAVPLAEGAVFTLGGREFQVSYVGGDGNDVTLTAVDTTAPTVTISAPSVSFASGAATVTYTVTYADANFAQSTLTAADVTLNGTPGADVSVDAGTGATRTVTLTNFTGNGPLGISLAADTAQDTTGNPAPAAGPSATFTVDTVDPAVMISAPSLSFANGSATVTYTVTYSDANFAQSTLTAGDVTLNGAGTSADVSVGTSTGSTRTVTLTNFTGNGPLGISLVANTAQDAAGNQAPAAGPSPTVTVDTVSPTVSIGGPSATLVNGSGTVTYTVTYADPNFASSSLTAADVSLVTTGTATATVGVDSGTGTTRTVTLTGITGSGTVGISLAGGTAADLAGNTAAAAGPSATFTADTAGPAVTIGGPVAGTNGTTYTYTVSYADPNFASSSLTAADVSLVTTGTATATVGVDAGTGPTRTVTLTNVTGEGTVAIRLAAGTAADAVGNQAPAAGPGAPVVLRLPGLFPDFAVAGADSGVVTVYHPDGSVAYAVTPFPGSTGVRPVVAEATGDRTADLLVGTGPGGRARVAVVDGSAGTVARTLTPFEDAFTGGVFLAAADLNGDGFAEVAVSPDQGGSGRVTVFDGRTGAVVADFFGIVDANFRGGARVAFGDLNGDGMPDLFVAAGQGGGPRVAVYDGHTLVPGQTPTRVINDFFVFEQTLRNGVYVAAGDVDGDGRDDLVLGGGPGGAPRVLVLSGQTLFSAGPAAAIADPAANFFAGDAATRDGVRVTTKNLDGDASADVVTGSGTGSRVTGYSGADFDGGGAPEALGFEAVPGSAGGVYVG